jgi:hypothetical protein
MIPDNKLDNRPVPDDLKGGDEVKKTAIIEKQQAVHGTPNDDSLVIKNNPDLEE